MNQNIYANGLFNLFKPSRLFARDDRKKTNFVSQRSNRKIRMYGENSAQDDK
jgi:hypothetical protein